MNFIYSEWLHGFYDLVSRNDFYGFAGQIAAAQFFPQIGLSSESHVLDLCCGTGGPARYIAKMYGCRVTGVDISEANVRIADARTQEAGLSSKVDFRLGNVLEIDTSSASYTHVFGSDSWCYFPNKIPLYQVAWRSLVPGGEIAFLDHCCDKPTRFAFEKALGSVYFESKAEYAKNLRHSGFASIQQTDLSDAAASDMATMLLAILSQREPLTKGGLEFYATVLETWSEALANLRLGKTTYMGCRARKVAQAPRA
jgi:ubiquinone/menaquinone biosynthesis C-methylase UbiE